MKTEKNQKINTALIKELSINFITIILMTAIIGVLTYFFNCPVTEIIRNSVIIFWGSFIVVFLWYQSKLQDNLEYDNGQHPLRFLIVYIVCFAVSVGMIFAPTSSWVFLSIMVVLALFSNTVIGLTGGSVLLLITTSLSESGTMYIFFLYFMIGLIGVSLFRNLGLDFQIAGPLVISGISSVIMQTAFLVIFENQPFGMNLMFMPLLNLFINMVLLFLILIYFSRLSMYLLQDKYSDINDQEFPLMVELKKNHKDKYYEAIHTAYLGERIARKLNMNVQAVKGCCYYYKIATETKELEDGTTIPITQYYDFPEELTHLIEECLNKKYGSKESCVVLTSNKVIRSILVSQNKLKDKPISYNDIIEAIFQKMMYTNLLDNCDISIRELKIMKKTFIEENLYYDFLR